MPTPEQIAALLAAGREPMQIETLTCAAEGTYPDWWCWRFATLLGHLGSEEYYHCGQCSGIFRTGAC